jgi:hypothetical protein
MSEKTIHELKVQNEIIKLINPEFLNETVIPRLPFKVFRYDCTKGRFYGLENKQGLKPSVTTVLDAIAKGFGYDKWLGDSANFDLARAYSNAKAESGTKIHIKCSERIVHGKVAFPIEEEWTGTEFRKYMSFEKFLEEKKNDLKILASEYTVYNAAMPAAGTLDIIATIKGKGVIIDIKSGQEWNTHAYQLFAYRDIFNQIMIDMGSKFRIEDVYCLYLKEAGVKMSNALAEANSPEEMAAAYMFGSYTLKKHDENKYKCSWVDICALWWDTRGGEPKLRFVIPEILPFPEHKPDNAIPIQGQATTVVEYDEDEIL